MAVAVPQYLHFQMAHELDELLQIHVSIAEGAEGLLAGARKGLVELLSGSHHAHPLAAPPEGRLDQDGIADLVGDGLGVHRVREHPLAAGYHLHPEPPGRGDGVGLVAHPLHAEVARADEVEPVLAAELGVAGVLGKKADPGMDRVGFFLLPDADDAHPVEVALLRRVPPQADQPVLGPQPRGRIALHVGIGLHQHHLAAGGVRPIDQPGRRGAPGMHQQPAHRLEGDLQGARLLDERRLDRFVFTFEDVRDGFGD